MKVKALIEQLSACPPEDEVVVWPTNRVSQLGTPNIIAVDQAWHGIVTIDTEFIGDNIDAELRLCEQLRRIEFVLQEQEAA